MNISASGSTTYQYAARMFYHLAPKELVGSTLLPLSQLRSEQQRLYDRYVRKYEGREDLLNDPIPTLDCRWQDVVFLTAIAPSTIRSLHEEAGFEFPELRWIQIDPATLEIDLLTIYWYKHSQRDQKYVPENWQAFSAELLPALQKVPDATRQHYADAASGGRRPFAFFRTAHILHKGALNIAGCPVVRG